MGYDSLCLEHPNVDLTATLELIEKFIARATDFEQQSTNYIAKAGIFVNNLHQIPYEQLDGLLARYVSRNFHDRIAYEIKFLRAMIETKKILHAIQEMRVNFYGINVDDFNKHLHLNAGVDTFFEKANSSIDSRNQQFATRLVDLYPNRNGLIFISGVAHAEGLIPLLKDSDVIANTYYLYTNEIFFRNYDGQVTDAFAKDCQTKLIVETEQQQTAFANSVISALTSHYPRNQSFLDKLDSTHGRMFTRSTVSRPSIKQTASTAAASPSASQRK